MSQDKIEAKNSDESSAIIFDGICKDENTHQRVIFQGTYDNGRQFVNAISISEVLKERIVQGQKVKQFINAVRSILKKCDYLYQFPTPEQQERNVRLSCVIQRNNKKIGYVEDMDYLLDCEYIYKQIFKLPIKSCSDMNHVLFMPNELAYFSELFQLGVLKTHEKNSQEPFCQIEHFGKVYIRISNALINLDISCK